MFLEKYRKLADIHVPLSSTGGPTMKLVYCVLHCGSVFGTLNILQKHNENVNMMNICSGADV